MSDTSEIARGDLTPEERRGLSEDGQIIYALSQKVARLQQRIKELEIALKESLILQAHYAKLLNEYDRGKRMIFNTSEEWINRLKKTGTIK